MEASKNLILPTILEYWIKQNASDIHLSEWEKMHFRINWKLLWWGEVIDSIKIKLILLELVTNNKEKAKLFLDKKDMDFTYIYREWISFRVNAFIRLGNISFVLRYINPKAHTIEELWLPEGIKKILTARQWLILFTWTSWSWKSTSMVSILNEINNNRNEHIVTVEDPVEFRFKNNKSIFSQREVWKDTKNMETALTYVWKEDPDIIVISEIKDQATMKKAIELSETWNLVLATLNANSSTQAISKILDFFDPELQSSVQNKLWDILTWIMCQKIIPKSDWNSMVWIFELLLFNMWIRNLVKTWNISQVKAQIETWEKSWMILMRKHAMRLENEWIIKNEDYIDLLPSEE